MPRYSRRATTQTVSFCLFCVLFFARNVCLLSSKQAAGATSQSLRLPQTAAIQQLQSRQNSAAKGRALLFYIFSSSDPEYLHNFGYFVRFGMRSANVDNVVVLQSPQSLSLDDRKTLLQVLANTPRKTIVLRHANECYDTGSVGWAMQQKQVADVLDSYDYFIVLNSSVKGPFLPPFFPDRDNWHRLLLERLGGPHNVHLVGPTISCEPTYNKHVGQTKSSPHVQTWLFAMDRVGLDVVRRDGRPFKCHLDRDDAIWDGEVGLSRVMLEAGHNIDCLLEPYQGVDWRLAKYAACNDRKNPMIGNQFYGMTLPPYATIFTKYKRYQQIDERSTGTSDALVLSKWMVQKW